MTSDDVPPENSTPNARPREVFSVRMIVSGKVETFEDPRVAGRAFFQAAPAERPTATHFVGNTARTMASTEIHGTHPTGEPKYFKSLPASHAPDAAFREGFLEAMEKSIDERLVRHFAEGRTSGRSPSVDAQLNDDLDAFAYREPGKAVQLWSGHSSERPSGPVLKAAVDAYADGLNRDAVAGRTADWQVSAASLDKPEQEHIMGSSKSIQSLKHWER